MNFKELGARLGLEEDEYRELVELFISSGGNDFANLQQALTAGDADKVMRSAHTIKGAAGNLGLMDVSAIAKLIEYRAEQKNLDGLQASVDTLKSQFEIVQAFLNG
ncbi:MAG: Hpt domain-containing protein [Desulfobacteraceae bacterium]|nr:Hpt domain-containing protein [Desulfobacteraceae bacterium]